MTNKNQALMGCNICPEVLGTREGFWLLILDNFCMFCKTMKIVGTNVRNDLQRPTTTYNDLQRPHNDLQ